MNFRGLWIPVLMAACVAAHADDAIVLKGPDGVVASFQRDNAGWRWTRYEDSVQGRVWPVATARFTLQMEGRAPLNRNDFAFARMERSDAQVVLETELPSSTLSVRRTFSFCGDGRTLRIRTSLRSSGAQIVVQQIGLLELSVADETFHLTGSEFVSCPVFGDKVFAGVEHPSAWCQAKDDTFSLSQHPYITVGNEWRDLPAAVFGSASKDEGKEALRRAFLRYLDTVRIVPADMHVHYNDWWTAPVPSSESFVLDNIATLKLALYDTTGFFFDSYAMDMGWSDPKSVWQIDTKQFPEGFNRIRDALAGVKSRPGLWTSPSSAYPPALDNAWLESAGYEVIKEGFPMACMGIGGRYQQAYKNAVLKYAKDANLAHVKFDGYRPICNATNHGHKPGNESYQPLAEGMMDVFDSLRAQTPDIALEPTCFGYNPSPWWLMHTPFIIGPFGDDCPDGRVPCPDWMEALTTARDIENLRGRDAFLFPSSSLECFDIIKQCPGAFQNHAVMAIGRGHWFISSYINPKFMQPGDWSFFAELMRWARANRSILQDPTPFGGNPEKRQAYGYAFTGQVRALYCLRNPWIEETTLALPASCLESGKPVEVRMLYPRHEVLGSAEGVQVPLGPYETAFVEVAPVDKPGTPDVATAPSVAWTSASESRAKRIVFDEEPKPLGPDWTATTGDAKETFAFEAEGAVEVTGTSTATLAVLCEGPETVARSACRIVIDGKESPIASATSVGQFFAAQKPAPEDWVWFSTELPQGKHNVKIALDLCESSATVSVFARGTVKISPTNDGVSAFPLYRPDEKEWSRVLVAPVACNKDTAAVENRHREVTRIDGIYLDTLDWKEATAGWGEVHRNASVMGTPFLTSGAPQYRGIGTHAPSRIVYDLPEGYREFAATAAYDREVRNGSVIFVVQLDGKEVYRSPVVRFDTPPQEIRVPLNGAKQLTLVVEDAGDSNGADHADWTDARLLK
jgi:hypothetical protein